MISFIIDFIIFAILVVGITAFMSIFTNAIGENIIGKRNRTKFTAKSASIQTNWNTIGGNGIHKKKSY